MVIQKLYIVFAFFILAFFAFLLVGLDVLNDDKLDFVALGLASLTAGFAVERFAA